MTQVPTIIVALGALLFLVGLLGGGITLKELSLPAITPRLRVVLLPISIVLMAFGVWLWLGSPTPTSPRPPAPSADTQPPAAPSLRAPTDLATGQVAPAVAYQTSGALIYQEDFEDGYAVGWDTQWEPSMTILRLDDGNHVLLAGNSEPVLTLQDGVYDYAIETRLLMHTGSQGAAGVVVRWLPGEPGHQPRYFAYLDFLGGWLNLVETDTTGNELPEPQGLNVHAQVPFSRDTWYTLAAVASGPSISVYLDGELVGTDQDDTLLSNRVGLWAWDGGTGPLEVYFDDIRVWSLP